MKTSHGPGSYSLKGRCGGYLFLVLISLPYDTDGRFGIDIFCGRAVWKHTRD